MAYACVRTDNMSGTTLGKDLVSLRYYDGSNEAAIENGHVVLIGDYLDGEREVRKATKVAANSKLADVALVASEEVVKTKGHNNLDEFINEAGSNLRGYRLTSKDVFAVTKAALDGGEQIKEGAIVELAAGTKLKAVASATASTTTVGKIKAVEGVWYVIEVD